jgi:phosphoglucosamine mutase
MNSKLFGTDGIRGQANLHPITPEVALQVGKALARVFEADGHGGKRVVIGKDTRLSGYMLETALTSGLLASGMDVFLVGPVPTPAVAHLAKSMGCAAGIMLTASHNPFDDNGIKIFDQNGFKLSDEFEERIEAHVASGAVSSEHIRSADIGKAYRIEDARGRYIEFAKSTTRNQSLAGLKIVLDCANGAAYQVGPWIFRELGANVVKIGSEPDGYNINDRCGALYPQRAGALVCEHKADVGIALDGDADRVIFTDAQGKVVDGDRILALSALDFRRRGALRDDTLVVTSMSNLGLHEAMGRHGIRVETTDVGDRYVVDRMRDKGYNLGGEKAGHIIFMDYATTGDGIIAALQVLRMMRTSGASLAELADCMTEYPQKQTSVPVAARKPIAELSRLAELIGRCKDDVGAGGRCLVRYSGTEAKLRILVEAPDADKVEAWSERITSAAREELGT